MNTLLVLLLQSLFVITNVAPGTVDTQAPVITNVTYGAKTPADGAILAGSATRFEFQVSATDNIALAYATLEILKTATDTQGQLLAVTFPYLSPLSSPFSLLWNEAKLPLGTYILKVTVYDALHNPSVPRVFTVKK